MASLNSQIVAIKTEMASRPGRLIAHVERVVEEAAELARLWDVDPRRVELAARGHDLYRAHPPDELVSLATEFGVSAGPEDLASPVLLHGPVAAAVMRDRFKIDDDEVLGAVRDHTIGLAQMPLIAKIVLLADKFEPRKRKRDAAMAPIRRLARRDLDTALLCWADWKWVEERTHGWRSHGGHWVARAAWVREHHADISLPGRLTAWDDYDAAPAETLALEPRGDPAPLA